MKKFSYVAKDTSGKTIKGIYEAEDAQEVLDKIHEQGLFCISYSEALGGAGKQSVHKFNTKELAFCCRQLAAMMTSGLTIVKALDILYKEEENKGARMFGEAFMTMFRKVRALPRPSIQEEEAFQTFSSQW